MPRLELENGGSVFTTPKDVQPAILAVTDIHGATVEVELANLPEIENVVKLIEEPDAF